MLTTFLACAVCNPCMTTFNIKYFAFSLPSLLMLLFLFRFFLFSSFDHRIVDVAFARHTICKRTQRQGQKSETKRAKEARLWIQFFYDDDYSLIQLSSGDCGYCTTFKTRRTHLMRKWHTTHKSHTMTPSASDIRRCLVHVCAQRFHLRSPMNLCFWFLFSSWIVLRVCGMTRDSSQCEQSNKKAKRTQKLFGPIEFIDENYALEAFDDIQLVHYVQLIAMFREFARLAARKLSRIEKKRTNWSMVDPIENSIPIQ